ncbi:peptidoglycan editing factor PgeF [Hyphomicrobium sp.]|uniref:peptidoglycan editing factor PgeF n=1 Tax=Hyphomicrobium sp. TaxID=82 RepID=UPI002CFD68D4|nr:peptidoglycan editing factor PgeF [Hyphomicrobium sp.]HRN89635.1 peptidoglycan editing factor PgeF [Hyphomicrobium sp.]HRQ26060.1 peptidoglycan editing factor PgeF [Hyphomicrobium sp.]
MLSPIEADNLSILPGIRHGFFTRQGGASRGLYASLNCGAGSKDDPVAVVENRARVAERLGSVMDDVQTIYQIHSGTAHAVERLQPRDELPKADALVTRTRGLVIGVLTADCAPVLFADAEAGVVGAAHAGWRGAIGGILEATIALMEENGADRSRILAALGPTIGPKSYEVGPEFVAEFEAADPANARFFTIPKGRTTPHFDLPSFVLDRLGGLGLRGIERQAHCTYENESMFFSFRRSTHRKEPDYGRQISAIVVA